jgi:hypothetical protein
MNFSTFTHDRATSTRVSPTFVLDCPTAVRHSATSIHDPTISCNFGTMCALVENLLISPDMLVRISHAYNMKRTVKHAKEGGLGALKVKLAAVRILH